MKTGEMCMHPLKCETHSETEPLSMQSLLLDQDPMRDLPTPDEFLDAENISPNEFIGKKKITS
jgi:hypothetical protein